MIFSCLQETGSDSDGNGLRRTNQNSSPAKNGRKIRHCSPVIDSMIHMANAMLDRDFFAEGLTLEELGIAHMTKEELLNYLNNGVYTA